MTLKRWSVNHSFGEVSFFESAEGEWVRASDAKKLETKLKTLEGIIKTMVAIVHRGTHEKEKP